MTTEAMVVMPASEPDTLVPKHAAPDQSNQRHNWTLSSPDTEAISSLAREAGLPLLIAELLIARGIETAHAVEAFFQPDISQLHDPYRMLGMHAAVERIVLAVERNETILIYGDYDVDGTVATVLLKTAIERIAALRTSTTTVRYHVPHRIREGYGMQSNILAGAHAEGVQLVISVDTGIRAFEAADEAKRLGLDLIVTDHHLADGAGLPEAIAVVNPNQPGCAYPCKHLCGAGVAFKLAQALLESTGKEEEREKVRAKVLPSFLKLLAIATIADAVPLLDENRVIAAIGLRELHNPVQPGLRALMHLAQLDPAKQFTATDVAFRLAPRINAAGRMDVAGDVVELFTSRDPVRAKELAEKLHLLNDERRATEAEALAIIEAQLASLALARMEEKCFVLEGNGWHRGVIGILASRVVDRTSRPALVIAHEVDEQGISQAYGSGRSIECFHLLDAISAAHAEGHLFTRFGGHAHAVGFSMRSSLVPELKRRVQAYASEHLTTEMLVPRVSCDAELPLDRITPALATWLRRFEPIGMANRDPIFLARGVRIAGPLRVMKERHIRLRLQQTQPGGSTTGPQFNCLGWHWAERAQAMGLAEGAVIDIAYKLKENTHPDFGGQELELCALEVRG